MNNEIQTKILLYLLIIPIITFSSIGSIRASGYVDPVTGYNGESGYDAIQTNGTFPDLMIINSSKEVKKYISIGDIPLAIIPLDIDNIESDIYSSIVKIDDVINNIRDKSKLKQFLIGNNLKTLLFQLVQIKNKIYTLERLENNSKNDIYKTEINSQIEYLEKEIERVEKFLIEQNDLFSLFGWFVNSL